MKINCWNDFYLICFCMLICIFTKSNDDNTLAFGYNYNLWKCVMTLLYPFISAACTKSKVEKSLKQKAVFLWFTTRSTKESHQIIIQLWKSWLFFVDSFICIKSFIIGLRLTVTAYWRKPHKMYLSRSIHRSRCGGERNLIRLNYY